MSQVVTDTTFNEETDKGLVLIDFWATWCGPCRMQAPILDQLSEEYDEDEFRIVKMDVDENPQTPQQFGIMSIPTLLLKKDGQVVEKAVGVHSKEQLRQMIEKYL
ncbi:thioredoxin [Enterococcus villorum]|uniref:Thioredoxin n=2 Tax=Enterococcus villorum TaxID=112904 RepID=A0A1V8YHX0_9ENTE|nr:thioredoxin [Enterococcus villorum]EOH85855.1 thioredoxin [Enterococcus villorum ATCC 700913]EOW78566.1 thioredoxin [Enterococcus villorum ATCC 700913]OQO70192.1 thioredoxin [Enterococcus villorum]OQO72215.1 thioredoxin [Enterococcus villorum]GEL92884.1 thioredoxin [Enterococcus villorum]